MLRLVSPGIDGEAVRAQVPRRLVASDPHHEQLIEMLVGARLVTSDEGVLEITHEALARAWPRLRGWLDDDVEGQRILHHLSGAADAWDTLGRPDSELYRGVRLTRALDWQARTEPRSPTPSASSSPPPGGLRGRGAQRGRASAGAGPADPPAADRARRRRRAPRPRARRRRDRRRAVGPRRATTRAASRGRQAAVSADARRVGARSQLTDDISLSLLLAAAGARLDDSPETRVNLLDRAGQAAPRWSGRRRPEAATWRP